MLAILCSRNSVPLQQFSEIEFVNFSQRVQPVDIGNNVLRLQVVQSAGRQNEPLLLEPLRQFHASGVDIAESHTLRQARGPQAVSGASRWAFRHHTTLFRFCGPAETKCCGGGRES